MCVGCELLLGLKDMRSVVRYEGDERRDDGCVSCGLRELRAALEGDAQLRVCRNMREERRVVFQGLSVLFYC